MNATQPSPSRPRLAARLRAFAPVTLVAATLVVLGLLLTSVSWWFLLLVAAGMLGPGVLRELGVLRDRDEAQRFGERRAGHHAFLAGGAVSFAIVAALRAGVEIEHVDRIPTAVLAVMALTWITSALVTHWGPARAARRVLLGFGVAWGAFAILANTGSEWTGWTALLLHPLLALPFLALAWGAPHRPTITGVLLVALGTFFAWFLGAFDGGVSNLVDRAVTLVLFVGPLLACGVALLVRSRDEDADEDDAIDDLPVIDRASTA